MPKLSGRHLTQEVRQKRLAFSPNGKTLVTASADRTARLWDVATGKAVGQPLRHKGEVSRAIFTPEAKMILTTSNDGTAQRWETATGKPVGPPLRHDNPISADGKTIVTADYKTARVWEAATGKPVGQPLRYDPSLTDLAISPGGKAVLAGIGDRYKGEARLCQRSVREPRRIPGFVPATRVGWVQTVLLQFGDVDDSLFTLGQLHEDFPPQIGRLTELIPLPAAIDSSETVRCRQGARRPNTANR
jgi:hypothetical protein